MPNNASRTRSGQDSSGGPGCSTRQRSRRWGVAKSWRRGSVAAGRGGRTRLCTPPATECARPTPSPSIFRHFPPFHSDVMAKSRLGRSTTAIAQGGKWSEHSRVTASQGPHWNPVLCAKPGAAETLLFLKVRPGGPTPCPPHPESSCRQAVWAAAGLRLEPPSVRAAARRELCAVARPGRAVAGRGAHLGRARGAGVAEGSRARNCGARQEQVPLHQGRHNAWWHKPGGVQQP